MKSSTTFYGNIFHEFSPAPPLTPYVVAYWYLHNNGGSDFQLPVVPDGSSDVIFYLDDSKPAFVVGLMSKAQLIPIPAGIKFFGIRFCPGILSFLINMDMRKLTNNRKPLMEIENNPFSRLQYKEKSVDEIITNSNEIVEKLLSNTTFHPTLLSSIRKIISSPELSIVKLAHKHGLHPKNLERLFYKHVGVSPKQFAGIMRFYAAHKHLLRNGLEDLVTTSLEAGYFDQPHFNREYKKLTGTHPTSNTMSILYKTPLS